MYVCEMFVVIEVYSFEMIVIKYFDDLGVFLVVFFEG